MATLKTRVEALEAKAPAGSGNYCLVIHNDHNCAMAQEEAISKFIALNGSAPVNFIHITFVAPGDKASSCQCDGLENSALTVTGPNAPGIMADLVREADGTALKVVKDPVQ